MRRECLGAQSCMLALGSGCTAMRGNQGSTTCGEGNCYHLGGVSQELQEEATAVPLLGMQVEAEAGRLAPGGQGGDVLLLEGLAAARPTDQNRSYVGLTFPTLCVASRKHGRMKEKLVSK